VQNGKRNISPSFFADSRRVLFASNRDEGPSPDRPNFELYAIDPDGPATMTGGPRLERLTYHDGFDGAPRFSPDGRHLVFTSSRSATEPEATDLFVALWE